MAYIEDLSVRALFRRLTDNIQFYGSVSDTWNQIGGLNIAGKSWRLIISLLGLIISRILIFIPFSFLGSCVERIKATEERCSVTE